MSRTFLTLLFLLIPAPVLAVSTSNWTQTSEEDFKKGTLDNVVATNLGDLKLSRAVKTLLEQDPKISSVNALAEAPDGTIYAGTGPQGVLLQIKDQKATELATIDGATSLTSLLVDKSGRLLIGTSGDKGKLFALEKGKDKPRLLFEDEGVQYVWSVVQTDDGTLYAATGPTGKLYEINKDGSHRVLLASDENNILSLATDGKDMLYAGTDPHGLVYRINRKSGESFVLYNAPESEVSALVLDKQGNLFAATAEAREESGAPARSPNVSEKTGRPEGGETGVPIPSENPKQPKPPALPDPNPGQPDPIPKKANRVRFGQRLSPRPHVMLINDAIALAPDPGAKKKPAPGPGPTPGKPHPPGPPTPVPPGEGAGETAMPNRQPPVNTVNSGEPRPEGNAVYKIDPDGFVTEIFRHPVLVLSMVEHQGTLLIATGSEGEIFQVNPAADETVVLAKVDPKQVTCLLPARDGNIYMGMANVGSIASMSAGYATKGTYTSAVLDATQISRFGKMHLHGSLPTGTAITVATRSGNLKEPAEKGWSNWSQDVPAEEFLPIASPSARFLQYRLSFTSKEGSRTPVIEDVNVAYQTPNLPPQIKSVRLTSAPEPGAVPAAPSAGGNGENDLRRVEVARRQMITWEASDPNNDALQFSLYFRQLPGSEWILLKEKLTESQFEWDTRSVADGRYEVKVVASDANANPPGHGKTASRVSDPIVVDNTPPAIGDLVWDQKGEAVTVQLKIVDQTSTVAACDYSIDSSRDWQMVLPVDNIFDSQEETVKFSLKGLSNGRHQVALRATDARGNQAFQNVVVNVKGPVAAK